MGKVYIEISEWRLVIGVLKSRGEFFLCEPYREVYLYSFEIKDGVIYDMSTVSVLINKFVSEYQLKHRKAVVCCPYVSDCDEAKKRLSLIQAVLCVSKAGLKVCKLFDKGLLAGG